MNRFLFILFLAGSFCLPTFTSAGDKTEASDARHPRSGCGTAARRMTRAW